MALVEEYYELNEAESISTAWKIIQIGTFLCAGCLGLWCSYTLALIRIRFDDKCYLFTGVKDYGKTYSINHIDWEGDFWCDYCQYTMVSSFIVAIIWATFFLMCGKGGKSLTGLPQPWRIVFCSLIFNTIYFSVSLSASIKIQKGTDVFCEHTHRDFRLNPQPDRCRILDIALSNNRKLITMTYLQLDIVTKTSWCCTLAWLILILISFFRIVFVVDFRMYKICVFQIDESVHNKKEEVLKVTYYEEPKKLPRSGSNERMVHYFDEEDNKGLGKGKDKKKPHQFREVKSPLQPNAAFYVTADIRMLDREKKRQKMKVLDEVFEKNQIQGNRTFRFTGERQSGSDDLESSDRARFLYRYPNLLVRPTGTKSDDDDSENEQTLSTTSSRSEDSGSYSSITENRSKTLKKKA